MKSSELIVSLSKLAALGGVCVLLAGAGSAALAQGDDGGNHPDRHFDRMTMGQGHRDVRYDRRVSRRERLRLDRLHQAYRRDARTGHYGAAERAHIHALAIRTDLRSTRQDMHRDHRDMNRDHRDMHQDRHDQQGDRGY